MVPCSARTEYATVEHYPEVNDALPYHQNEVELILSCVTMHFVMLKLLWMRR